MIEPNRLRRLDRGREAMSARLDLHGCGEAEAYDRLTAFILGAHAAGGRAVLVITGKGSRGEGLLRRRVPQWLAEPPLREVVAGLAEAHRRQGGAGALYVALKANRER
jgi:DNA-nicking Smr family endonuclease